MSSTEIKMTSNRPYLLRAIYEWLLDNDVTPQLLVNADHPNVKVPRQFVEDGRVVLNVNPSAISHFSIGNTSIEFSARFSGTPYQISLPMSSVMAIFARENGQGMAFSEESLLEDEEWDEESDQISGAEIREDEGSTAKVVADKPALSTVKKAPVSEKESVSKEKSTPSKGKPQLKIVK